MKLAGAAYRRKVRRRRLMVALQRHATRESESPKVYLPHSRSGNSQSRNRSE